MAVTDAVKLSVYNEALRLLGERRLASLTEAREPRRVLDGVYEADAVVRCLGRGDWNFATRSAMLDYDPAIEPTFGFRRAFQKPADVVRLTTISLDEYFRVPLIASQYVDEAGYWLCDNDTLYVRYVSSGDDFGLDGSLWTPEFRRYLSGYMAFEACERITNSGGKMNSLARIMDMALKNARSRDSMAEGVKFPPSGSWVRSRVDQRYQS